MQNQTCDQREEGGVGDRHQRACCAGRTKHFRICLQKPTSAGLFTRNETFNYTMETVYMFSGRCTLTLGDPNINNDEQVFEYTAGLHSIGLTGVPSGLHLPPLREVR